MSKKKLIIAYTLLFIAAIAIGVTVYFIAQSAESKRANQVLRDVAFSTSATTAQTEQMETEIAATDVPEETYPSMAVEYTNSIDFVSLQAINSDIYSWIEIPDTPISYPVLQHYGDYQYYLNHTFDDQYNTDGALFTEDTVAQDYSDFVTVIYGHNLRNQEMFGSLRYYTDADYLESHRQITIYTPYSTLTYTIFANVVYSNALISSQFDFSTEAGRQAFLDEVNSSRNLNNNFYDDVEVTTDSNILVLSTCNGNSSQRFLVLAVLTEREP